MYISYQAEYACVQVLFAKKKNKKSKENFPINADT
jgi:hypothetical protein